MKKLTYLFVVVASAAFAQRPDFSAQCKTEMNKLAYMVGDWKGEAIVRGPGGQLTVQQTEHIEWKLDGLVLAIEGTGRQQEAITFQAFAVVHFDPFEKQLKLKSFVKEGFSTNAYFTVLAENKFEWGFDIPTGGKSKYTITLDPVAKTWYEKGEFSRDGATWMTFIEMNLVKL